MKLLILEEVVGAKPDNYAQISKVGTIISNSITSILSRNSYGGDSEDYELLIRAKIYFNPSDVLQKETSVHLPKQKKVYLYCYVAYNKLTSEEVIMQEFCSKILETLAELKYVKIRDLNKNLLYHDIEAEMIRNTWLIEPPSERKTFLNKETVLKYFESKQPSNDYSSATISEEDFWLIIDKVNEKTESALYLNENIESKRKESLLKELILLDLPDIVHFECLWKKNIQKLDHYHVKACLYIISGYISDEMYLYFRHWLLMRGESRIKRFFENPNTAVEFLDSSIDLYDGEQFMYLTDQAFLKKVGFVENFEDMPSYMCKDISYDSYETQGDRCPVEELPIMYFQIWKIFRG